MIKHIVFFKLNNNSLDEKNELKNKLLSLKDKIDYIVDLEVGLNFAQSDRAYDVALIVTFENKEDLNSYRVDKYHQEVIKFIKQKAKDTKVVDFEY